MIAATSVASLASVVAARSNEHQAVTAGFTARTGVGWHERTPAPLSTGRPVSIVIPVCDSGYSLPTALDAVAAQDSGGAVQVIVVDDVSVDDSAAIAAVHPVVDVLVRLPQRVGPATARDIGIRVADAATVLFVDADMVLPAHVAADVAARAEPGLVLVGFGHDVAYEPDRFGRVRLPGTAPDLYADPRACQQPDHPDDGQAGQSDGPAGVGPVYPLDESRDLQGLGYGAVLHGLDLPAMVQARLLAAPRDAVMQVGGFHPAFRIPGLEGPLLGASLIALGLLVVPLRQAVAWHVQPPDPYAAWQAKRAAWPDAVAAYQRRLAAPPRARLRDALIQLTDYHLAAAEVTTR